MIDINKLKLTQNSTAVVEVARSLGWDPSDDNVARIENIPQEYFDQIEYMSAEDFFERWCEWNGLLGSYHSTIFDLVANLMLAEYSQPKI